MMIRLLFGLVLPLVIVLAVGLVGYNYFFGTPEEQQNSVKIFSQVQGLGSDVFNLLVSEKGKFDDGKYNDAMDKIGSGISLLKEQAGRVGAASEQFINQLNALEQEKQDLQNQLAALQAGNVGSASQFAPSTTGNLVGAAPADSGANMTAQEIQDRINDLARRTEQLGSQIEQSGSASGQ